MHFEWAPAKAHVNAQRHGVRFEEAATAFRDPLSITIDDPDLTLSGKLVVVVHVERGETIRIVSAKLATRRERKSYEED